MNRLFRNLSSPTNELENEAGSSARPARNSKETSATASAPTQEQPTVSARKEQAKEIQAKEQQARQQAKQEPGKSPAGQKTQTVVGLPRHDEEYAAFERVKVIVRVRPPIHNDEVGGALHPAPKDQKKIVVLRSNDQGVQEISFDRVFGTDASQAEVYDAAVRPIVEDVCRGYNGTIMAYGQTGAGKTYTLTSIEPDSIGMMPRAANEIFNDIEHDQLNDCTVYMSYIQIYMEIIKDLLKPASNNLSIREDAQGVYLAGVQEVQVASTEDCLKLLQVGEQNRVYAFTNMNAQSSRSHVCVQLTVIKKRRELGEAAKFANGIREVIDGKIVESSEEMVAQQVKVGRLFIVDLAGSERLKKSGSKGVRATEARSINLSLTVLGMCINARADPNSTHVPFRDSKLTRLLQESLGGNAKTCMVVNVSDVRAHLEETMQSLQFGQRAMALRNKPVVNSHIDYKAINDELATQLDMSQESQQALEAKLQRTQEQVETLSTQVRKEQAKFGAILDNLRREKEEKEMTSQRLLAEKEKRLADSTKQLNYTQSKLQAHVQELATTKKKLMQVETSSSKHIETLKAEKTSIAEQLKTANETASALQKRMAEQVDHYTKEINKLEAAKKDLETTQRDRHKKELEQARVDREQEEGRLRRVHAEELAAKEKRLRKEFADDRRQLEGEHGAMMNDLQAQLQDSLHRLQASVEETYTWQARVQEVEEEKQTAQKDLVERIAELENTLKEAVDQINSLQQENLHLTREAAAAEADRRTLRKEVDHGKRSNEKLTRQLDTERKTKDAMLQQRADAMRKLEAAVAIQKYYRRWQIQRARDELAHAQTDAVAQRGAASALKQRVEALEERETGQLAWTGAQLVASSFKYLQTGIEHMQYNFLTPKRHFEPATAPPTGAKSSVTGSSIALALGSRGTFGESFSRDIAPTMSNSWAPPRGPAGTSKNLEKHSGSLGYPEAQQGTPASSHIGTGPPTVSGNGSQFGDSRGGGYQGRQQQQQQYYVPNRISQA